MNDDPTGRVIHDATSAMLAPVMTRGTMVFAKHLSADRELLLSAGRQQLFVRTVLATTGGLDSGDSIELFKFQRGHDVATKW